MIIKDLKHLFYSAFKEIAKYPLVFLQIIQLTGIFFDNTDYKIIYNI